MKAYIRPILISLFLTFVTSFNAAADEVTDVINDVAAKLVKQLPMDKKIALKSLSPEETGLPEEFLRRLVSDLEASLLTASNFEIKLLNRNATEEIWSDAIEFGDSKFEDLYEASEASTLILLSPRVSPVGLEINVSAYELKGDLSGVLIASSGNQKVNVDLQNLLGLDINTIEDNIQKILAELDTLSRSSQRIEAPQKYADFIHNARYSEQNNQIVDAIRSYAAASKVNGVFADPYLKIAELASFQFGRENATKFIRSQLSNLDNSSLKIINIALGRSEISDFEILQKKITDPVILALWLNEKFNDSVPNFSECSRLFMTGQRPCDAQEDFVIDVSEALAIRVAINTVRDATNAGYFSQVFLDPRLQIQYVKVDQYSKFSLNAQDHFNMLELFQDVINSAHSVKGQGNLSESPELQLKVFSPIITRFPNYQLTQYAGTKPFYEDGENIDFALALATNLARAGYGAASAKMLDLINNHITNLKGFYQYDHALNPGSDGGCQLLNKLQDLEEISSWISEAQYASVPDSDTIRRRWGVKKSSEECSKQRRELSRYSDYLANFYTFTTADRGGASAILQQRKNLLNTISNNTFDDEVFLNKLHSIQPNGDSRYSVYRSHTEAFTIPKLVREGHTFLANQFVLNVVTRENFGIFPRNATKIDYEAITLALVGYIFSINNDDDFSSLEGVPVISNEVENSQKADDVKDMINVFEVNCRMGECYWVEILNITSLGSRSGGNNEYKILKVQIRTGTSVLNELDYPDKPEDEQIEWANENTSLIAYCHNRYPAIDYGLNGREEVSTLGILSPYGYEQSSVSLYLKVCHDFEPDPDVFTNTILESWGYEDSERLTFNTKDDWMCLHSNHSSCERQDAVKRYCWIEKPSAVITNVQNFTNLRRQAGLNGQVIGQVPLGATVSVVNPGNFLRTERCAATCNGTNQNAIKQCIDNNDVWIEVDYNGRSGFLSRKFLE